MDGVKKRKYFQLFKLGLPSLTFIVVLAIVLVSVLGPKNITGSVYNVSDLENKIDKVSAGDYLNYNINGYSNWKVLRKDEYNGTIEVVSETNVKDITFDYTNSASAQEILQEAADEYTDDRYAISARPVSEKKLGIMA